jgi:HEAT repeat protein
VKKRLAAWLGLVIVVCAALAWVSPGAREPFCRWYYGEPYSDGRPLSEWIAALSAPTGEERRDAISHIGALGPEAAPAIPALAEMARHHHISMRTWAISCGLAPIGPKALPILQDLLKDRRVRTTTVITIGSMGPSAKAAVPDLIEALDDSNWMTRTMACESLGKIGPGAEAAIPALRKKLDEQNVTIRQAARSALRKIAPQMEVEPSRR